MGIVLCCTYPPSLQHTRGKRQSQEGERVTIPTAFCPQNSGEEGVKPLPYLCLMGEEGVKPLPYLVTAAHCGMCEVSHH